MEGRSRTETSPVMLPSMPCYVHTLAEPLLLLLKRSSQASWQTPG